VKLAVGVVVLLVLIVLLVGVVTLGGAVLGDRGDQTDE
jgi:hypothetical protein